MNVSWKFDASSVISAIERLPEKVRSKAVLRGMNAAGGAIKRAALAIVARESGALARSLRVKAGIGKIRGAPEPPVRSPSLRVRGRYPYVLVGPERRYAEFLMRKKGKLRRAGKQTRAFQNILRAMNRAKTAQDRVKIASTMTQNLRPFLTQRRRLRVVRFAVHVVRQAEKATGKVPSQFRRPVRYAHLVEKGTSRGARPQPFLHPALASAQAVAAGLVASYIYAAIR